MAFGVPYLRSSPPVPVAVASPATQDIENFIYTTGTVVPVNEFLARASTSGTVQKMLVHPGEHVQAGELLVLMKDPYAESRVAAATASLRTTQVNAENVSRGGSQEDHIFMASDKRHADIDHAAAEDYLVKVRELEKTGGASPAEVRAAQQRLDAVNATLETIQERGTRRYSTTDVASWKSKLGEAEQALKAEQANLANVRIVSPIAGTAYLIPARAYDFVNPGAELLHVADLTRLEVRADFDESDMGKLHEGEPVRIQWEGKPDHVWHGHVQHAPMAAIHIGIRSVGQSILSVDDATGDLPPNSTVSVSVLVDTRHQVLTVPREALHMEGPERFVYRVEGGHLARTRVETGLVTLDKAEITKGLAASDVIALHSADNQNLLPNMSVEAIR